MEAVISTVRTSHMSLRSSRCRLSSNSSKRSSTSASESADASSDTSTEASNEEDGDGVDESDQPAVCAPSYEKPNSPSHKAGLRKYILNVNTAFTSDVEDMFVGSGHPETVLGKATEDLDVASSEDDDDEIYQAVDEISDDEDALETQDERILLDEFAQEPLDYLSRLSDIGNDEDFALGAVLNDFSNTSSSASSTTGLANENVASSVRRVSFKEDEHPPASPVTALTTLKAPASISSKASSEQSPLHPSTFHDEDSDYDSMRKLSL